MNTYVGWLADDTTVTGGAELTQAEFRAAAPRHIEVVDCPPGAVVPHLDLYVVHNCVKYTPEDFQNITGPGLKFWHDVGPFIRPEVKAILNGMRQVCCSPIQADYMDLAGRAKCIPPPVNLEEFRRAGDASKERAGAVSVGSWRNHGKAPHKAAEWAQGNGGIHFYGGGYFAPKGSVEVTYDAMPELLAGYETFVFLPTVIEPFGRLVVEAWAAGCEIVTNRLVGARWWIEEDPGRLETAAEDFWREVLR